MTTKEQRYILDRTVLADMGYRTKCWLWQKYVDQLGYSRCNVLGETVAHRVAYRAWKGEIPAGLTVDHLCRVRHCCNPEHLEAVIHRDNVLRGTSMVALNAVKTHCKRGHEFTPANTIPTPTGGRRCRTCQRLHQTAYNHKIRGLPKGFNPGAGTPDPSAGGSQLHTLTPF